MLGRKGRDGSLGHAIGALRTRATIQFERQDFPADVQAAKAVFDRLVALEAAYDPRLGDLYAHDAVVIERVVENGMVKRTREIPMLRYRQLLPEALRLSQLAQDVSVHSRVSAHRVAEGWVAVRSLRTSSQSRGPAPYELLVRQDPDLVWRIAKETATLNL